ncbi:hypothetical protein [Mycobacterium sp. GA-0227b]|uniref:hypothetical protein n=1 Tax=Mycobacterium sp. GA-0227b TaxID=1772274 RepID=UPI001C12C8BD|nr:hypothetical protein [Mycobacterium sp. GA-0227b]
MLTDRFAVSMTADVDAQRVAVAQGLATAPEKHIDDFRLGSEEDQKDAFHRQSSWITNVIHEKVRRFHQMNHGRRDGVDWRRYGVAAKALVGLWIWAQRRWVAECPSAGWGRHAESSRLTLTFLPRRMW